MRKNYCLTKSCNKIVLTELSVVRSSVIVKDAEVLFTVPNPEYTDESTFVEVMVNVEPWDVLLPSIMSIFICFGP